MTQRQEHLCQQALAFTDKLADMYFVNRRFEELPKYMSDMVSWIGTGKGETSKNIEEAKRALTLELQEYNGSFTIKEKQFEAAALSDDICIVYGELQADSIDSAVASDNLRLSLIIKQTSEGLKLQHLHFSYPDIYQEQGHFYVEKAARYDVHDLKRTLDLRNRQLDIRNRNVPGSAHQCKNDENFTLISVSDSFLSMFGYTREEISSLFHNNFIEMVYPKDREAIHESVHNQLKNSKDIELEYRIVCKNGQPVWVLDKARLLEDVDGNENIYSLLIEITKRKQEQEELRLSLERHRVIMNQTTDIIFEWDIHKDTLLFSQNWYKKFGYIAINQEISKNIPLSKNIHPNDIYAFVRIMQDIANGNPYSETELRIKDSNDCYIWCRIRATAQYDSEGNVIKAVGVIIDIDNEKRQKQELLEMARKDALTGLYNKAAIKTLVEQRMMSNNVSGKQALLILDVDHFKTVNDTYGHLVGDSILSSVAAVIKSQIRATDLAARIGGDEYLIYMADVTNEAAVLKKAEKILIALEKIVPEAGALSVSCSIGAAIFAYGTVDYLTLYHCADQALYIRKNSGRNGVTLYQSETDSHKDQDYLMSAVSEVVGYEENTIMDEQLAQYAFRKLYEAKDIYSTMNRLLEIIGQSYDVSRVYIFESSEDGKCCSNTFEWCADGIEPQIDHLQNLSYVDDLDDYLQNFDENGLFYCADIKDTQTGVRSVLEPQGIYSMLQCAMLDEGEFVGYVGFDECRESRSWKPKQVATFKLTADVLSVFLIKYRQKQKNKQKDKPMSCLID